MIPYGLHTEGQQDFNVIFSWYPSLRKVKLPAYKAGHQKGNSNLSWGNISPKPPERAIHPRAQHGVFWQNCIKDKNVADIPEERVPESLGPFQQGTHNRKKKDIRFMHVLHGCPLV